MENRKPIHFKEMQQLLDIARETHQKVNILAWELKGNITNSSIP